MNVFVAGHRGFVGRNLTERLIDLKYNVVTCNKDLMNAENVNNFISTEKPNWVFNCAAVVGGIGANIKDPYKFLFNNLTIQNNIINACIQFGVKKVLNLGSSCIYPKDYRQPLKEEDLLAAPLESTNEGYALAKIAGLKLCEYANRTQDKTKFVSLMPANLYGKFDNFDDLRSHAMAAIIKKVVNASIDNRKDILLWGTGAAEREWLYIDDLIDGIIWAMNNLNYTETFLNIGTGKSISMIDLVKLVSKIVKYPINITFDISKPDGTLKKCMDVSKINQLGWKYKIELEKGIEETIKYYRDISAPI